ncbi:sodium:solute symporter family protein [Sulfuriroseicoccus oceanibius]|uniref:Uncharacterized protein n=1 Tax=Sulfuriroseicoccus oceanibius TaxID=2707525 RepID=A0A6B3LFM3_9BACT|nr:sodium:solute symporter [Sulfuriroseicoccus oceanibius]QQL45425.1 hypothetical protein G3M56_002200 [Sulfuriroseicoccus oceanibius]
MHWIDWAFLAGIVVLVLGVGVGAKHFMNSVADFLVAGRTAGRYMMAVSGAMAAIGAISIVSQFEMNLEAGFALAWWDVLSGVVILLIAASGWVRYRFRQTRCLTLAEFLERRYSRGFRIFTGAVGFGAGLLNFGIFPAVGTRFFIHFLGIPPSYQWLGIEWPTYAVLMAGLIGAALFLVLQGGQVSVLITDFLQGVFANVVFVATAGFLLVTIPWTEVADVLTQVPAGHSKTNPFDTGEVKTFNFWFMLIGLFGLVYNAMSWQGEQAYNASAESAHETKMAQILGLWRELPKMLLVFLVPILVFVVLNHSAHSDVQADVQAGLAGIENPAVRNQMTVPMTLSRLLPAGLLGAFAAMMLAAFISTHNTYLHSWASILVQDVVIPLRGRPLSPKAHIWLLRGAIVGVALFIYAFSLLFVQVQEIMLYMALTGAIFAGWSGAVLIGGLYWKRGTTLAAWTSGIVGVVWTLAMFVLTQLRDAMSGKTEGVSSWGIWLAENLPHGEWIAAHLPNGQWVWGLSMAICSVTYVVVSLVVPNEFDLPYLLGRAERAGEVLDESTLERRAERSRIWRWLGISEKFSRGDIAIALITYVWNALWVLVFVGVTGFVVIHRLVTGAWFDFGSFWIEYWHVVFWIRIVVAAMLTVWLAIGGFGDLGRMMGRLRNRTQDDEDDGFVRDGD